MADSLAGFEVGTDFQFALQRRTLGCLIFIYNLCGFECDEAGLEVSIPWGETKPPFQFAFKTSLKIDFQGSPGTSDGNLILVRELDDSLGFSELIEQCLAKTRGEQ